MHLADYHLHTLHSFDSTQSIKDVCDKAIQMSLAEIAITDHFSVIEGKGSCGYMDKAKYLEDIEKHKELYDGKLIIKRGLEICEPYLTEEKISTEIYQMNLDFILGSVHSIDGQGMNTFAEGLDGNDLYERYFEEILLLSKSKNIDVIAHMDFIKRYAFNKCGLCDIRKNEEMLREIFKSIVANGKGIEINTSGLRSACNEALPGIDMLKLYKECGGEIITCGSDAHFTKDVGFHIKESYQLLKDLGYKYTYTFKNRQAIGEKL